MSDDERVTRLVRVGPSGRDPMLVAVVLVAIVGLALLKPWGTRAPATSAAAVAPSPAAEVPASPGNRTAPPRRPLVAAVSGVERLCHQPSRWWLAAVVRWPGQNVQTREALPAVTAGSPLDPAIPFERVHSSRVHAIGYCAPVSGSERPPDDATVAVWRLDPGSPVQIQPPTLPEMGGTILGRLWSPPPGPVATLPVLSRTTDDGRSWATGRYVITIQAADRTYRRWLGVEIVLDGID